MKAAAKFIGVLSDGPKLFRPGDPITKSEAKALGLADKPHLTETPNATERTPDDDA